MGSAQIIAIGMPNASSEARNSGSTLVDIPGILSRVMDDITINKADLIALKDLDALASTITHANEVRLERLHFQKATDMTDPKTASILARLTSLDGEAFVAVRRAIDVAPLSDEGRLEAWYLFLANRPG